GTVVLAGVLAAIGVDKAASPAAAMFVQIGVGSIGVAVGSAAAGSRLTGQSTEGRAIALGWAISFFPASPWFLRSPDVSDHVRIVVGSGSRGNHGPTARAVGDFRLVPFGIRGVLEAEVIWGAVGGCAAFLVREKPWAPSSFVRAVGLAFVWAVGIA